MRFHYKKIIGDPRFILLVILVLALNLRLYSFSGFVSSDPQDEGIYVNKVMKTLNGKFGFRGYTQSRYKDSPIINPANSKEFALGLIYPVAFFCNTLGFSEFNLVLWPLFCSLGSVIVIYLLGRELFNENVGLISAFLLSIFPLDVFYSTRVQIESPMLLFFGLSAFFILRTMRSKSAWNYFLSGVFLGIAYIVKTKTLIFLIFYALFVIYRLLSERRIDWKFLYAPVGFLLIFSITGLYYYEQCGDFLLAEHVRIKVNEYQFTKARGIKNESITPNLRLFLLSSKPIYYSTLVLGQWQHRKGVDYFGYFYYFVAASIVWVFLKWIVSKISWRFFGKRIGIGNFHILMLWLIPTFIFLEFGFVKFPDITLNPELKIDYFLIFKVPRYLIMLTYPSLIAVAYLLSDLYFNKLTRILFVFAVSFLLITSVTLIDKNLSYFSEGHNDLRAASKFFREHPDKAVYSDHLGAGYLKILDYDNKERYKRFGRSMTDSYVISGGSRSVDLVSRYVYSLEPSIVRNPPENWIIVMIIPGEHSPHREKNMTIYYAP